MCLAVPMKVEACEGFVARCSARGVERTVSLIMMAEEEIAPGDHVMVHLGQVIQKVSEEEARLAWELYDEILGATAPGEPAFAT